MRPNPLRDTFEQGTVALGGWLSMPSPISAEVMAGLGLEYVCIDMQHGLIGYGDSVPMLTAMARYPITPTMRVPWNTPDHIGKALDAGAMAIIIPMVNSAQECQQAVAAASYPPRGNRSYGPVRAMPTEGADYFDRANETVAIIPMIETVAALDAIDDILSVDGVAATYVGPADLAISMGFDPGTEDPTFLNALDRIVERCDAHNVVPGIHTTTATAQDRLERGYRMVTITSDLVSLRNRLADDVKAVREGRPSDPTSIY